MSRSLTNEDAYYFTISGAGVCESATVEGSASGSFDNCGNGVITRTWDLPECDGSTTTVTQTFVVNTEHEYTLTFPGDIDATCADDLDTSEDFSAVGEKCDLFAYDVQDVQYDAVNGSDFCYKIERTYTIVNWCEWNEMDDAVVLERTADAKVNGWYICRF